MVRAPREEGAATAEAETGAGAGVGAGAGAGVGIEAGVGARNGVGAGDGAGAEPVEVDTEAERTGGLASGPARLEPVVAETAAATEAAEMAATEAAIGAGRAVMPVTSAVSDRAA